jgi:hypothetical protein
MPYIGIGNSIMRCGGGGVDWTTFWIANYISALSVLTTSDTEQTVTATIVGTGHDGVSFEYSSDGGVNWSAGITDADGVLNKTGLIAAIDYTWRARLYKGTNYGSYITAESNRTFGVALAITTTLANTHYNTFPSLSQHPTNKNKIIRTYLEAPLSGHSYIEGKILRMQVSNDKGQTWGAITTVYDPGGILCVQEQHAGYTSDGRFHILATVIDDTYACTLKYLYSDNDGVSFTVSDISALVANVTRPIYRNSGNLIENNGVLIGGLYKVNAGNTSCEQVVLRLVSGTWSQVSVNITTAYESEMTIESLGGDNLIILVREDVTMAFVQYSSADNGLTWTRLGILNFNVPANQGWPSKLHSFMMNGEKVIVHYMPRYIATHPVYAIYGKATDLLELGMGGWNYSTLKTVVLPTGYPYGLYYDYVVHGDVIHPDNDYNAVGCYPFYIFDMSYGDLLTFNIDTTDFATLQGLLFPSYAADADSNAFNAVNNTNPTAIVNLIGGFKQYGIYTKTKAAYPMIGGTAALHKYNLVNPADTDGAFRLTFAGTWTHAVTGAKPNGIDAVADTHLNASSGLTLYSASLGYYSRTNVSETGVDMGASHNDAPTNTYPSCMLRVKYTSPATGRFYAYNGYLTSDAALSATLTSSLGFILGSRTTNVINKIFINGVQSGTTNTVTALNSTANLTIYIGAYNYDGVATSFTTKECAFAIITDGLTDTEVHNLNRIIHYFQKALSRNV